VEEMRVRACDYAAANAQWQHNARAGVLPAYHLPFSNDVFDVVSYWRLLYHQRLPAAASPRLSKHAIIPHDW
jgi:hypothetical protein